MTRLGPRPLLFALAGAAAACGDARPRELPPLGQILLSIDTDAPLPHPPGHRRDPNEPAPLFDRLRIEVFAPGDERPCAECTHEFDVDRELVASGRASVGITPPLGASGFVARVRLYSARFVELGEPRADTTIDVHVSLPPISAEGIVAVTLVMRTDDVAKPIGSRASPVAPRAGGLEPGFSGSWAKARRVPCTGAPADDEVCIPGGAYWMGHPLAPDPMSTRSPIFLVVLDPFFFDKTEVTVAAMRASGAFDAVDPLRFSTDLSQPGALAPCTFTTNPSNQEDLPVTCMSWDRAYAYCAAMGKELPTEAQFQYVASALEGRLFVWGEDPPACNDAVYARASSFMSPLVRCPGSWMDRPGRGAKDRLELAGGTVVDVAGNVAEHTRDTWNLLDGDPCWAPGVVENPICTMPTRSAFAGGVHTVVGGSWAASAAMTAAATRVPGLDFELVVRNRRLRDQLAPVLAGTGFRCARSGR